MSVASNLPLRQHRIQCCDGPLCARGGLAGDAWKTHKKHANSSFRNRTIIAKMRLASALLVLLMAHLAAAQQRCKLGDVQRPDGSYMLGHCDELLLFGEKIGDAGVEKLGAALATDKRLKLVDLWSNGVGPKGAEVLARALTTNNKLEKLYLNENDLGSAGAAALAKALAANRALAHLWLSRNKIGDAGAEAIAEALRKGQVRRLEALDLWGNQIGPRGGKAIADALQTNPALRTLEMRDNPMGDQTAVAFAEMMPKNRALSTLDLVGTGVSTSGIAALLGGLKVSTANPYLVLFSEHLPHMQQTSWEQQGKENAP